MASTGAPIPSLPAFRTLLVERDAEQVVTCLFNRPESRNALNETMAGEFRALLAALRDDPRVRALILAGAGEKAFVSGADIAELRDRTRFDAFRRINTDLFRALELFPAPTIAAVRGWALGGGCELAMACDLRVCGEGARFGQPEVGLGIIPGAGGTYRLAELVGAGRAKEMVFTGRVIDAREALAVGLVNRVVPDGEVLGAARALAAEIARHGALAVRLAKVAFGARREMSTDAAIALESTLQAVLFEDEEKRRRMSEFLEKKKRS